MKKQRVGGEDILAVQRRGAERPLWWLKSFCGSDLWDKQKQIIVSVRDNARTAVTACHAIGKTYLAASVIVQYLYCNPDSIVILTAPTWRQVSEAVWREVRELHSRCKIDLGGRPQVVPRLELGPRWFALGFSATEPENLQGFHSKKILVIIDEASGVASKLFKGIRGLLASGDTRLLLLGNPTKPFGEFYDAFHGSRQMYQTFQVSAWDTPNLAPIRDECMAASPAERLKILRAAPCPRPYLIKPSFVADAEEEFGIDSDYYRVRVLGQFPRGGEAQLIPLYQTEEACNRYEELVTSGRGWWLPQNFEVYPESVYGGLDVARFGANRSALALQSEGQCGLLQSWQGLDTVELVSAVEPICSQFRVHQLQIDETGLGGGPLDNARRWAAETNAVGYLSGGRADNPVRFANRRAESFWGLRERHADGSICYPRSQRIQGQLSTIEYDHRPSRQIFIKSKSDMLESPDEADALAMAFDQGHLGQVAGRVSNREESNWRKLYGTR